MDDPGQRNNPPHDDMVPLFPLLEQQPSRPPDPNPQYGVDQPDTDRYSGGERSAHDQRATFKRTHTFGYDARLDSDYAPGGFNEWGDPNQGFKPRNEMPRRIIVLGLMLICLVAAGFLVASKLSNGTARLPQPTPAPTTAPPQVSDTPNPSDDITPNPSATGGNQTPGPTTGQTGDPITPAPTAGGVPQVTLSATYTPKPGGGATVTCQSGAVLPKGCRWQVTTEAGHDLIVKMSWAPAATMHMIITTQKNVAVFDQTGTTGEIKATLTAAPSVVFLECTVVEGGAVNFTVGLADHDF